MLAFRDYMTEAIQAEQDLFSGRRAATGVS